MKAMEGDVSAVKDDVRAVEKGMNVSGQASLTVSCKHYVLALARLNLIEKRIDGFLSRVRIGRQIIQGSRCPFASHAPNGGLLSR